MMLRRLRALWARIWNPYHPNEAADPRSWGRHDD